ncbi:MAG: hypothetical protein CMH81_05485 [Nitrospiraceae bacterium]|nr:hypothetical protein [Nitrospiraceae bacterium]
MDVAFGGVFSMCNRLVRVFVCLCIVIGALHEGFIADAQANGRITFTGKIFHITQPGRSLDEEFADDTVPPGQWMLSGSWRMEIDPDFLAVTQWKHNMIMLRTVEGDNPLPKDMHGNATRNTHTVQLLFRDGKVRSLNFQTGFGRITGTMDTMKNGKQQFLGDDVEILLTGGRGFKGMTNLEIRFVTEQDTVTNFSTSEDTASEAQNAREHFGELILGMVQKITVAE